MIMCAFSLTLFAQNITVTGSISDNWGEALIGVTVQVQGTGIGTVTDIDGKFTLLNVSPDATLLISYVGMKSQTIPLNGRTTLTITLEEDTELLEEVIVVGFGQQKKESVVGAIAQTSSKVLEQNRGVSSLGQALTGTCGVVTMTTTGRPEEDRKLLSVVLPHGTEPVPLSWWMVWNAQ